ncbi:MAG: alkylhalidase [Tistrella sp.]|jgi:flavin-dependent dehydrogenase|uniref:Alkylhalidase n=1 Tax=Tistrella mobilis TaxID=171437 RepID=A0A3B9IPT4_9PROT|nr:NAD(P)/FAD-dependent oxidoreductase [Tistrella sp.]MAD36232.1 alkylhalidase [Tistrella sp.]MBA77042.1 alkylhalidase [Tistrella sp.]HAE49750.1 alkylhalidase [Tistrella mobilis]
MSDPVLIIGAGPAGCVAALTLRRRGRDVVLLERATEPAYKIGESLLPGTLSLLDRLGLMDRIMERGFVRKPSATFVWGLGQAPWTFSFATPRPEPWIYDHAIQVYRQEFDGLLLDAARDAGVDIRMGHAVASVDYDHGDGVLVRARRVADDAEVVLPGSYVVDATGQNGLIARELGLRRYDEFYRSLAVWNYYPSIRKFTGDLDGTTFSITFEKGWVWMIPLKDGTYSVGAVVDVDNAAEINARGRQAFLEDCLRAAPEVASIVDLDDPRAEARIIREWSYNAERMSMGRAFLAGDSACFTDPLFSQGVHLATQSGVYAGAAIDFLIDHPDRADDVHAWYDAAYRESYSQYHEFLASFYSYASEVMPASSFWSKRRVQGLEDKRFSDKTWFARLTGQAEETDEDELLRKFVNRSGNMISLGQHLRTELTDDFTEEELAAKRVQWIGALTRNLNAIKRFEWTGGEVSLVPTFKVDPMDFSLVERQLVADGRGRRMMKYSMTEAHRDVLAGLSHETVGYRELVKRLKQADDGPDLSSQIVIRLIEAGMLKGYDRDDQPVEIQHRLRFDGVGAEYEV